MSLEGAAAVTTNVNKWGSRAAAKARRDKAAQRTPLPPRDSTGVGNPAADIIREEWEKIKAKKG